MKLFKLTTQDGKTRKGYDNETQWGEGVTHSAEGEGRELCGPDVIHAYTSPLLAVLMNPIHAQISNPKLWEAEGDVVASKPDKVGCKTLTTVKETPLPQITTTQKIAFAVLCAKKVYKNAAWNQWADKWLSGEDRSQAAAYAADYAAYAAAYAADYAAAAAAYAADYAAAAAAYAADAATYAAYAAARAAAYAAYAAYAANIDLSVIAEEAVKY